MIVSASVQGDSIGAFDHVRVPQSRVVGSGYLGRAVVDRIRDWPAWNWLLCMREKL